MDHPTGEELARRLVVGLGNPGRRYQDTRHNIGYRVVEAFLARHDARAEQRRFRGLMGELILGGRRVTVLKPETYMNVSGEAVGEAIRWLKLSPAELLVVCDCIDLPAGRLRLRTPGSHGGQKGLASVLTVLGTDEVPRLRIGIGRDEGIDPADYVLMKFNEADAAWLAETIPAAVQAVETWIAAGPHAAMNETNG